MAETAQINISDFTYPEGEANVIARLLQGVSLDDITNRCREDFFHDGFLREIFKICYDYIIGTGKGTLDFPAIVETIHHLKGGSEYALNTVNSLYMKDVRSVASLDYVLEKLEEMSNRRRLIMSLQSNLTRAQNREEDIKKILADTEEAVCDIERGDKSKVDIVLPKDIMNRRHRGLVERYHSEPVFTGWDDFDKFLSVGFAPTKISVIAGRTAMGKSFFKTNLIINMCKAGVGVINVCPEQGFDSEHDRIDAIMTGIHLKTIVRIKELTLGDDKFQKLKKNSEIIEKTWNYACVPTRGITVAGVRSAIRRVRRSGVDPKIVFIDLFDRLEDVNVARDRTATISVKLGQIEQIAQEENVHICLLAQINRGPESRRDKRPTLADLRDCGNFEQDADLILLLYREGYYNRDIADNTLDVEFAKQRDGVAGVVFQFMIMNKQTLAISQMGERRIVEEQSNIGE